MIHDCQTVLKVTDLFVYFSLFKIYNSLYTIEQVLSLRPRSVTSWTKHAQYIKFIRVLCPGDTAYFCESCPCNLCVQCKDNHVKDLKTKDHNVMRYSDKFTYIQTETRSHASFSLFYKPVLLTDIKADVKTCIDNFSLIRDVNKGTANY